MKKCNTCQETKPVSDFNKCKSKPDGLAGPCRECQHKNGKKHYGKNKKRIIKKQSARKEEINQIFYATKDNKPCADCGRVCRYFALDYDHRDPGQKIKCVSELTGYTKETLLAEIDKCDLVCATCHRYRTFERRKKSS